MIGHPVTTSLGITTRDHPHDFQSGRLASAIHIRRANARDESPKVLVYYILLPPYSIHNRRYDLFEFAADSVLKIGSDDEPSAFEDAAVHTAAPPFSAELRSKRRVSAWKRPSKDLNSCAGRRFSDE